MMDRVQNTKLVLWLIAGLAAAVGVTRFIFGLGATTNLTDATPWGLWIGFDVMGGVALAAGGFVMTALVYIMRREEFHSLVKPAVLTAFLGYVAVIFGLMFDLGLPWNIWHMMVFWNPHSPLFEVGWCVMLYTTVLLLEFSPVPLEEASRYAKIRGFLMKFRFPLVLLGIMLSTLHQSSLGSLFLIMPFKVHPLWYSSILPIHFFISAVALGMGMVAFESIVSHWLYRRNAENTVIAKLGFMASWVLLTLFLVRMGDIAFAGELPLIYDGSFESGLFIAEMLISTIIPMILFWIPSVRRSPRGQLIGAAMIVFGMVFNRINVGGITQIWATQDAYVPSWMEISISLGVVSAAVLVFMFAIEHFHVWEARPSDPEIKPFALPRFDRASDVWLGTPAIAAPIKYSLAFVLAFAIGFALIPESKINGQGVELVKAHAACGYDLMYVDGNRDGYGVNFPHVDHINRLGKDTSCVRCHHMNIPRCKTTSCYECHRNMYSVNDVFRHDWHASPLGANHACFDCHEKGQEKTSQNVKRCDQCHNDLRPGPDQRIDNYMAPSYVDAMHVQCVDCHREQAKVVVDKPNLARCGTCHETVPEGYMQLDKDETWTPREFNRVIMPSKAKASQENHDGQ